jgi:hypothetical protein
MKKTLKHYAVKHDPASDFITCACGVRFLMHYPEDPECVTWSEGPGVTCPDCLPKVVQVLYDALLKTTATIQDRVLQHFRYVGNEVTLADVCDTLSGQAFIIDFPQDTTPEQIKSFKQFWEKNFPKRWPRCSRI